MIKAITALLGLGSTYVTGKIKNKQAQIEGDNNIRQEKLRQNGSWDEIHARNSANSWKDEWFTILFSIPLILAFFPSMVEHVDAGFKALDRMPEYYKQGLAILVGASVGYQKLVGIFDKIKS